MRLLTALLAAVLLVSGSQFEGTVDLPQPQETAVVGVHYRATTTCGLPIQIGDAYWTFERTGEEWPPPMPWDRFQPYAVPGVITLTSPTTAVFRADVNGQELPMARSGAEKPWPGAGCV